MSTGQKQIALRRFLAFGIDWLVIVIWGSILFGIVMLIFSGNPPKPSGPWKAQAIGFFTMTLPVLFYFSICEHSSWRATLGKRILGLRVAGLKSDRIPFSKILLRNAVKFVPWEMGHLIANQAIFSSSSSTTEWLIAPMILSLALPLWWVFSIYFRGESPYDQISGISITLNKKGQA